MNSVLKAILLALYALAGASFLWAMPLDAGSFLRRIAALLLIIHALEVVFMFKHVRLYRGALGASVALTLLFGLLHWKPLADQARRGPTG